LRNPAARSPAPASSSEHELDIGGLYRQHARTVARWAGRLGGHDVDVEDVVQEVFLIAKQRLRRFDGGQQISTWLFRTTEKIVQTARRKQRLRRWLSLSTQVPAPGMGTPHRGPAEVLQCRRDIDCVYRVLDRLNEKQRRVLILFELEGLSTHEIAALTGVQVGTVRIWLFRARARFIKEHAQVTGIPATTEKR